MNSGFYTGLAGMRTQSAAIGVIGNNLANVNTVGYKGSRANFAEMFSASGVSVNGAGQASQVGLGVQLSGVQQLFGQGSLQPTETVTDLALQGGGFFTLRDSDGTAAYTRAGNFSFSAEGFLVSNNGFRVQGYTQKDASGKIVPSGAVSDIQIPAGLTAPPEATTYFRAGINLNTGASPNATSPETFTTGTTIFDSKGEAHELTIVFTPQDADANGVTDSWGYEVRVPNKDVGAGATGFTTLDSGTMTFGADGKLASPSGTIALSIPTWANGAAAQTVNWNLADDAGDPVITNFSAQSALTSLSQDGYTTGRISSLAVDAEGVMSGIFSNGKTIPLAQLAIATFNNPGGLFRNGQNAYLASNGSGPAALGTANTGGRGGITANALELSNVDITEQFTDMIVTERGYQSNSRVIATADQMLQEAISIKR